MMYPYRTIRHSGSAYLGRCCSMRRPSGGESASGFRAHRCLSRRFEPEEGDEVRSGDGMRKRKCEQGCVSLLIEAGPLLPARPSVHRIDAQESVRHMGSAQAAIRARFRSYGQLLLLQRRGSPDRAPRSLPTLGYQGLRVPLADGLVRTTIKAASVPTPKLLAPVFIPLQGGDTSGPLDSD